MITKILIFFLRVALGWLFFYAGITKVLNPGWSAAGYLKGAATFSGFYDWLASSGLLPVTNFLNEWGLTAIGVCLILGIFLRPAAYAGAAMMILYYFPVLKFPLVGDHSYIVDEHIVYALAFLVLAGVRADQVWGIGQLFGRKGVK